MRILITGGGGFQGSHLAQLWVKAGHDITILSTYSEESVRNLDSILGDVRVVWGSVTDSEIVDKTIRNQEVIVHLAARINVDESIADPVDFIHVNVSGTYNILQAVRRTGGRLIFSSSCEVYGASRNDPHSEAHALNPHSPYAASKAGADRMCYAYYKTYDVDVTIVRPCNIYGERQKSGLGGAVIPKLTERAMTGNPVVVFGDGLQQREYMNVDDLVAAYDLLLDRPDLKGETINFGSGEVIAINDIAERIAAEFGVQIEYLPGRPGEVAGFDLDSTKAKELGFVPKIKFWDGLLRYVAWRKKVHSDGS
jgi:dTDP-glucose 4,6-dehydratase